MPIGGCKLWASISLCRPWRWRPWRRRAAGRWCWAHLAALAAAVASARALRKGAGVGAHEVRLLKRLLAERFQLQLQIQSLAGARRLLALWHVFHIPLGVAVFTLAFIHIGATLYFATFLK